MTGEIYLDNGATTKLKKEVIEVISSNLSNIYGNASSIHHIGEKSNIVLNNSRKIIADSLNAENDEIIFTSGGTESNNLALKGIAFEYEKRKGNKGHLIISKIEHDCVLNTAKWLEKRGFEITQISTDKEGFLDIKELKDSFRENTFLVSIIHANNEIGVIQNIKEIYNICKERNVIFHTDACQSYTKIPIDSSMADMITINAHKIHGPKGIGALYIKKGIKIVPLLHGGGHERNLRSGTENVPSIAGFAEAVKQSPSKEKLIEMEILRDYLIKELLKIPNTKLNGPIKNRLPNNVNVSFASIEGEAILGVLDLMGICASTGSACSSRTLDPSHVMMSIEDNPERAHGSVRLTLSEFTTKEEVDKAIEALKIAVNKLRKISPLGVENNV